MSYFFKIAQKSNRQKVSVWTNSSAYGLSCHVGEANCHASKQTNLLPFYMGSCFTRSPQSHRCLNGFFLTVFIVTVSFLRIPFKIIWACMEAGRRNPSHLLVLQPMAIKVTPKKSRFRPNRNVTGTIYHWSVILRRFSVVLNSAKRDANGFFKVLLLSSHLLISRHPVRKSKFGACAVMRYCPF